MKGPIIFIDTISKGAREDFERVFNIPLSNPKMDDGRRTIHEEDNAEAESSMQAFLIKRGDVPLGNHFHRKKTEIFFILEGEVLRLVTDDETQNNRREYYKIPAPSMIVMPPGIAHTFFLAPGSKMLCYGTERFDPTDMTILKLA